MTRGLAVVLLVIPLALAGCLGGTGSKDDAPTTSAPPTTTQAPPEEPEEDPSQYNPFHTHDLWGGREEVFLFNNFTIELGEDPDQETRLTKDALIVGFREFTTLDDGSHYQLEDQTDVVFQGTNAIVVRVEWDADEPTNLIPGLTFYYKHAGTPIFEPITDIQNGQDYVIPLGQGTADMAHQERLSRWRFQLEAFDPELAPYPMKAFVAKGTVDVTMKALNGGQVSVDPPHPFNFLNATELYAGEIERTLKAVVVNATGTTHGDALTGWKIPLPHIVPWETHTIKVWLHYNHTGPTGALPPELHELGLVFTDASGPEPRYPTATSTAAGFAYYEFPITQLQADDPYAYRSGSDWTWGVYPMINGQRDVGGEFEGDVHLRVHVVGDSEVFFD